MECHGEADASGSYNLSTYFGALGTGTDETANAIAGDGTSELLRHLEDGSNDPVHAAVADALPELRAWVGECSLAYSDSPIHPAGILNAASPDFHGTLITETNWNFDACATCHGEDFEGGTSKVACTSCHEGGPKACATCHTTELLTKGAHSQHMNGRLDFTLCSECHVTPTHIEDEGHLGALPAEVSLNVPQSPGASYDASTHTCRGVYCHGGQFSGDTAAALNEPTWIDTSGAPRECGSCHGLPPSNHAQNDCVLCHGTVAGPDRTIANATLHLDGIVELGRGQFEGCSACHGSELSAAPPLDVEQQTATSEVTIGMHESHLRGTHRLTAPIECEACHVVPTNVTSAGHLDTTAPAEVVFSELATQGGALPTWNRTEATCADVYCHGGGTTSLSSDEAPGLSRTPVWTRNSGEDIVCGACHGAPPVDSAHDASMTLDRCAECHDSVDAWGNPILDGNNTLHINGVIDVR